MAIRHSHIVVIALLLISGCRKDDVDVAALNTNPFDIDYVGAPVFEVMEAYDEPFFIGMSMAHRFKVVIRVREDRLLGANAYTVRCRDEDGAWSRITPNTELMNSEFSEHYYPYTSGAVYCFTCSVGNAISAGADQRLCATAP